MPLNFTAEEVIALSKSRDNQDLDTLGRALYAVAEDQSNAIAGVARLSPDIGARVSDLEVIIRDSIEAVLSGHPLKEEVEASDS